MLKQQITNTGVIPSMASADDGYSSQQLTFADISGTDTADGVRTSLLHPPLPALQPQSRCRSFPALLQLVLVSLSSRIKPLLKMRLEALEHRRIFVQDPVRR